MRGSIQECEVLTIGGTKGCLRGASSWDKIVVSLGGNTCNADELDIDNRLTSRKERLDCRLVDMAEPGIANVTINVLPVAMNDEECPNFLCVSDSVTHGYGIGYLTLQDYDDVAVPFVDIDTGVPYDFVLYPQVEAVEPARGGARGGNVLTLRGTGFARVAERNAVLVDGVPCQVLAVKTEGTGAMSLTCEVSDGSTKAGCREFSLWVGASSGAGSKFVPGANVAVCAETAASGESGTFQIAQEEGGITVTGDAPWDHDLELRCVEQCEDPALPARASPFYGGRGLFGKVYAHEGNWLSAFTSAAERFSSLFQFSARAVFHPEV